MTVQISVQTPRLLALDFDGVIIDGLVEYFQVSWRTYREIWQPAQNQPPVGLEQRFYPLRAVIETGWEMPVLIRALMLEKSDQEILDNWGKVIEEILTQEKIDKKQVGERLDGLRDEWICDDLDGWLGLHRFYPGVVEKITATLQTNTKLYIITTKEGRFVEQLLQRSGVKLGKEFIFGKENKRPKYEILRELVKTYGLDANGVWFVEDRLKTLELVQQQPDLKDLQLYLADWGYNTQAERLAAQENPRIKLINLSQFAGEFQGWTR